MRRINKKGISDELLHVLMEIAIIALVILLFFYIIAKLLGWGADDNTLSFFNALGENVQLMMDRNADFEYQSMVYYATNNERYYVFGFTGPQDLTAYKQTLRVKIGPPCGSGNSNSGYVAEMETTNIQNYPTECNGKACLCLYKLADNVKDFLAKPVKCKPFDGNIVFHGYFEISEAFIKSNPGMFNSWTGLFLQDNSYYSDYPDNLKLNYRYLVFGPACVNPQDLYIEKYISSSGRTHILISPYLSGDQIRSRTSLLSTCPDNSDPGCIGALYNTNMGSGFCYYDESLAKCVFISGMSTCPKGQELSTSCFCGSTLIDKKNDPAKWKTAYCYNYNGQLFASRFDCSKIVTCKDYCTTITEGSDDCVGEEQDYCTLDSCHKGLTCTLSLSGVNSQVTCSGT